MDLGSSLLKLKRMQRGAELCAQRLLAVPDRAPWGSQQILCSMDVRKLRQSTTGVIEKFKTNFYSVLITEVRVVTGVQFTTKNSR